MEKRTLRDINVQGKRVLVRVDLNAPQDSSGRVTDDTRLRAVLPTIRYLLERHASIVLMSHLGRPQGVVHEKYTLAPIASCLQSLLQKPIIFAPDCVGSDVQAMAQALKSGEILLLENLRFHPEEEKNDPAFAASLAALGEIFVNDAFGTAHRAHASTEGVAHYIPAVAGLLMQKELEILGGLLSTPEQPFAAIIGGAKVSTKLEVLQQLLSKVALLALGGGMLGTFLQARGYSIGDSLVEPDLVDAARSLEHAAAQHGVRLLLPEDVVIADAFSADAQIRIVPVTEIPAGWRTMDIGPKTIQTFKAALADCRTIFWNGPMGVCEMAPFAHGTHALAAYMAQSSAITIIGGGDSVAAIESQGLTEKITHVSTGGGATLELLEGRTLPGVAILQDRL